jgi:hypothetical protein
MGRLILSCLSLILVNYLCWCGTSQAFADCTSGTEAMDTSIPNVTRKNAPEIQRDVEQHFATESGFRNILYLPGADRFIVVAHDSDTETKVVDYMRSHYDLDRSFRNGSCIITGPEGKGIRNEVYDELRSIRGFVGVKVVETPPTITIAYEEKYSFWSSTPKSLAGYNVILMPVDAKRALEIKDEAFRTVVNIQH